MDQDEFKALKERLAEVQSWSVADVLQSARLGTEDNFESLASSVQSALEMIAMIPTSALDDLPEPALRAVRASFVPLLNLHAKITQYGKSGSARKPAVKQSIESSASNLPETIMSTIAAALSILHARQNATTRSSPAYTGREGLWKVLAPLGHGGQGAVFRAWNPTTCMAGALKIVKPDAWRDQSVLAQRLRQEKETLDNLRHPNILRLLDYGEEPAPFIVTQIATFGTLQEWLPTLRGDFDRVTSLSRGAARGVKHAHDSEVIHRDIKPSNLFLLSPDFAAVGDFGILRPMQQERGLTIAAEGLVGDPVFAPPEANDKDYSPNKSFDVFSLGATIHCALKGEYPRRPYWRNAGDDYEQLSLLLGNRRLAAMDELLSSMLAKEASRRPTIDQICDALSRLPTVPQGERKKEYCPQCGGAAKEVTVSGGGLYFGAPGVNYAPKAWRCENCKLVSFYT